MGEQTSPDGATTPDREIPATIVCLCGSTRFHQEFHNANLRETLAGKIVLTIGVDTKSDTDLLLSGELTEAKKGYLDRLHFRKIELAHEILVLNVGGYIGDSTKREIAYAQSLGKPIRWLEEPCNFTSSGVVVFSEESSHLLLILRKKFPVAWALPSGHGLTDESPEETAKREYQEETGLTITWLHEALTVERQNPCRRSLGDHHRWHVFLGEVSGEICVNPEECQRVEWVSLERIEELCQRTDDYEAGRISQKQWEEDPGMEPVWRDHLKDMGII